MTRSGSSPDIDEIDFWGGQGPIGDFVGGTSRSTGTRWLYIAMILNSALYVAGVFVAGLVWNCHASIVSGILAGIMLLAGW